MKKTIECPVNFIPVNQNKIRVIALLVLLLSVTYLLVPHWSFPALLLVDFFLRAFGLSRYSLLGTVSGWLTKKFSMPYKPVDSAPKVFAALIGFAISDVLFSASALGLYDVGKYIAGLLVCFSFLESAFGFCAGCYLYTLFRKPASKKTISSAASS